VLGSGSDVGLSFSGGVVVAAINHEKNLNCSRDRRSSLRAEAARRKGCERPAGLDVPIAAFRRLAVGQSRGRTSVEQSGRERCICQEGLVRISKHGSTVVAW